jgi:hypothetical protein
VDVIEILVTATKLLLGIVAFVLVGWLGARNKRIGGVLFTFPLLNGIAMLAGADPLGIAGTIYLVVMWNGALFLVAMYHYEYLPPLPAAWHPEAVLIARVLFWTVLWAGGATALALVRDKLSSAGWLFLIQLMFAVLWIWRGWRAPLPASLPAFGAMWFNWSGVFRVVCFVFAFLVLLGIAYVNKDARWIGWASALPLPGIFALATLSATHSKDDLLSLGDTVLLGPLLVIPFNWLLSRTIDQLRVEGAGTVAEIATVVVFWVMAAAIVLVLLPPFARWRDGVRSKR